MSETTTPIEIGQFRQAIRESADSQVFAAKEQLENSINKLMETNSILDDEIQTIKTKLAQLPDDASHDELKDDYILYDESRLENSSVIQSQVERVEACLVEFELRGLQSVNEIKTERKKLDAILEKLDTYKKTVVLRNELEDDDKEENKSNGNGDENKNNGNEIKSNGNENNEQKSENEGIYL